EVAKIERGRGGGGDAGEIEIVSRQVEEIARRNNHCTQRVREPRNALNGKGQRAAEGGLVYLRRQGRQIAHELICRDLVVGALEDGKIDRNVRVERQASVVHRDAQEAEAALEVEIGIGRDVQLQCLSLDIERVGRIREVDAEGERRNSFSRTVHKRHQR